MRVADKNLHCMDCLGENLSELPPSNNSIMQYAFSLLQKLQNLFQKMVLCLIDLLHFPQLKYFNGIIYLHFLTLQNFKVPKFNRPPALSPLLYSLCYISPFVRAQLDNSFGEKKNFFLHISS